MLVNLGIVLLLHLVRCVFSLKYCLLWGGIHAPPRSVQSPVFLAGSSPPSTRAGLGALHKAGWEMLASRTARLPLRSPSPSLSSLLSPPPTVASWIPE